MMTDFNTPTHFRHTSILDLCQLVLSFGPLLTACAGSTIIVQIHACSLLEHPKGEMSS
jgi:hypothetical protein